MQLRIDPPVDARYLHTTYLLDLAEACRRTRGQPARGSARAAREARRAAPPRARPGDGGQRRTRGHCAAFVSRHGRRRGEARRRVRRHRRVAGPRRRRRPRPSPGVGHRGWHPARDRAALPARGREAATSVCSSSTARSSERCCGGPGCDDFRIGAAGRAPPTSMPTTCASSPRSPRRWPQHGIVLAGLDVIAGRLIEVNVTCPGGMHKTDALLGTDLSGAVMRRLLHHERVLR